MSTHKPTWTEGGTVLVCGRCASRCPAFVDNLWVFLEWMGQDCQRSVTARPAPPAQSETRFKTAPQTPAAKKKHV